MKGTAMKRIKHGLVMVAFLACTVHVANAAEAEPDDPASDEPVAEATVEPAQSAEAASDKGPQSESRHMPTAQKKTGRDDDVFRPSEEISEDFAVSFPVDI